jgi:hypothetical protein
MILVDHAIFRAFNKGALGMLEVSGEDNLAVFSGQLSNQPYDRSASNAPSPTTSSWSADHAARTRRARTGAPPPPRRSGGGGGGRPRRRDDRGRAPAAARPMAVVPAGRYMPLYSPDTAAVRVESFRMDRYPVTRSEFAAFVAGQPPLAPEPGEAGLRRQRYLADWRR